MFSKIVIDKITSVAEKYDYEVAALLAVVDTESAGTAFWNVNGTAKPAVRFEGHYFHARLEGEQLEQAVKEGLASTNVGGIPNPSSYAARYALIDRAAKINKDAAYESTSWGLGQVMGANWKDLGFDNVQELVDTASTIEGQVELMVRFIEVNDLKGYIISHNWTAFAKAYNGPGYKKNGYHTKMKKAYEVYASGGVDVAKSDEIRQMQTMLNAINPAYALEIDGTQGPKTTVALRDFQLKNALKVDGKYGLLSRTELEKDYLELNNKKTQDTSISGTAVVTAGTLITEAAKQIEPLAKVSQIAQWVFLGLLVVGVLFTLKTVFFKKIA